MEKPEYVITDTYAHYLEWRKENPELAVRATYLANEGRCRNRDPGVLHRGPGWEDSKVLHLALQLEDPECSSSTSTSMP